MKTRLFIIVISLIAVFACEKPVSDVSCVTDFQMYIEDSELNDVALMLTEIGLDTELCNEVHSSVTAAIEKGLDEDLYFRELWMNSADVKVKSYDSESILKSRLESYFMRNPSTKNSEGNFLKDSDIEIYWPYSENWDGKTFPVIAPVPLGQECDTLYGYKVISMPGETVKLDTVLVDDDYAYENPVWIINHMEFPYDCICEYQEDIVDVKSSDTTFGWYMDKGICTEQYDKLSNGASEFYFIIAFPPASSNSVTTPGRRPFTFTRKQIRKEEEVVFDLSLNLSWSSNQLSNHMIFIESDDGEPYNEYRYVSYTQDSTGLVQNYQFNFTCYNLDTIMSEMTYPRETILDIDLNGEDVWWKEDAVKWTYTRK